MIKFNDFAERYADVITVTKPDLSGVGDYRLPDIGHNKNYPRGSNSYRYYRRRCLLRQDKAGCAR